MTYLYEKLSDRIAAAHRFSEDEVYRERCRLQADAILVAFSPTLNTAFRNVILDWKRSHAECLVFRLEVCHRGTYRRPSVFRVTVRPSFTQNYIIHVLGSDTDGWPGIIRTEFLIMLGSEA